MSWPSKTTETRFHVFTIFAWFESGEALPVASSYVIGVPVDNISGSLSLPQPIINSAEIR